MYQVVTILVKKQNLLYDYCDSITNAANNLYNATLFRIRQVMTAMSKNSSDWQENEQAVMRELETYLPAMNEQRAKSKRKKNPSLFTGKPKLPHYKKKERNSFAAFISQTNYHLM